MKVTGKIKIISEIKLVVIFIRLNLNTIQFQSSYFEIKITRGDNLERISRSTQYAWHEKPIFHVPLLPSALFAFVQGGCYGCGEREIKFLTIRTIPGAAAYAGQSWTERARIDPRRSPSPRKSDDGQADGCECAPSIGSPLIRRRSIHESRRCKRARIREKFTVPGSRCDPRGEYFCAIARETSATRPDSMGVISLSINEAQIQLLLIVKS